ncbi:ABC transporter ATP-binding protein [Clostridium malenominatum]|uniref:ABC transporter ATP-binding protein n=1 Tax=Clostridium malenominatum TaxID=1539 RepID=A0ABN1J767_9CLOT
MNNILEIKNLRKEYDNFTLKDISFNLERGYIMGFIGPNGAGKSTTIKLIMNLIKKKSGEITVLGKDNLKYEREVKEKIGFVYDENYYYEDLTINEIKRIISPFYKYWDDAAFNKYLKDFDLNPKKKIKTLSKGMKMKFSLAMALSHNADLIIMDEPTSGLDPVFRQEILDILYNLIQDENKSVFFSTHITTDLEKIADYITFINKGEIVFSKPKDEIMENYALIKGSKELLDYDLEKEFIKVRKTSFGFEALTNNVNKVKKLFAKENVVIDRASLEDIMVYTANK